MVDLEPYINWDKCELLNAAKKGTCKELLKQGPRDQEGIVVESDADEQLLITIAFQGKVKIHSLSITSGAGAQAPKEVMLFTGQVRNFDDTDATADQSLDLESEQLGQRLELRFVKFQQVETLTIFIKSNQDDEDTTILSGIKLWGVWSEANRPAAMLIPLTARGSVPSAQARHSRAPT